MAIADITASRARELLGYDPETGVLTRLVSKWPRKVGKSSWRVNDDGYLEVNIDRTSCLAHRVAWLIVHGEWPNGQIDHKNGIRTDNRLCNLRAVAPRVNSENQRRASPRSKTGVLGVSAGSGKKGWRARIQVDGSIKQLGTFATQEKAHEAYVEAKRRLHEGCTI